MPEPTPAALRLLGPLLLALLAGCAGQEDPPTPPTADTPVPTTAATPEPAAFDVELVKSNYTKACADPIGLDELFCKQVRIDDMRANGGILIVPTTLSNGVETRQVAICLQFAVGHFDRTTGDPLGYVAIDVEDRDGGNASGCSTRDRLPHGWELLGVVMGPREADPVIYGFTWTAWAARDGELVEGHGDNANDAMEDLVSQLRAIHREDANG